jgi:hypothetical protein
MKVRCELTLRERLELSANGLVCGASLLPKVPAFRLGEGRASSKVFFMIETLIARISTPFRV